MSNLFCFGEAISLLKSPHHITKKPQDFILRSAQKGRDDWIRTAKPKRGFIMRSNNIIISPQPNIKEYQPFPSRAVRMK